MLNYQRVVLCQSFDRIWKVLFEALCTLTNAIWIYKSTITSDVAKKKVDFNRRNGRLNEMMDFSSRWPFRSTGKRTGQRSKAGPVPPNVLGLEGLPSPVPPELFQPVTRIEIWLVPFLAD